jgi:hypothetical protein
MPPVPPAGISNKGPRRADPQDRTAADDGAGQQHQPPPENLDEQDQQGNIKQNTTNQGYQQDR